MEQLCAHYVDPCRLRRTSQTELQAAVLESVDMQRDWIETLRVLGHTSVWVEDGELQVDSVFADVAMEVHNRLCSQYLRVWLRECKTQYEQRAELCKTDALRVKLKNHKAKHSLDSSIDQRLPGGPSSDVGTVGTGGYDLEHIALVTTSLHEARSPATNVISSIGLPLQSGPVVPQPMPGNESDYESDFEWERGIIADMNMGSRS